MEPVFVGIAGMIIFLALIFIGVHIPIALGLVGFVGSVILLNPMTAIQSVGSLAFFKVQDFSLSVIPLFVLMGFLATSAGVSSKIYDSLQMWFGRVKGGLGIATVGACTAFGTVCGSSLVTSSVFARVSVPEMIRAGYDKSFAYGIVSAAGNIGMLIPPSVLIVVYGFLTEESIGKLLIAGISPGIMLFIVFSAGIFIMVSFKPSLAPLTTISASWKERFYSFKHFITPLIIALIIIGGIYLGVFTPSEAAAIAALVLLIVAAIFRRPWQEIKSGILVTMSTTAMIFLLLVTAGIFARFLALSGLSQALAQLVVGTGLSPIGIVIASSLLYLLLGCFLDSISCLTITIPIIYPVVVALNIDPFYYAMVVIVALHIGNITPPVGLNVFAVKAVAGESVTLQDLFKGVMPFLVMMLITLALYIAVPVLSTWLPAHL